MRAVSLIVVPFLAAGTLAAQAPASRPPSTPPVPTDRSVWFDAGALLQHQIRAGFEGLALGRYTVGLSITYDDREHPRGEDVYPMGYAEPQPYVAIRDPYPCGDVRYLALCAYPQYAGESPRYRAWGLNLAARYYPEFFSFRNGSSRMMVYAGGFVGLHWRVSQESPYIYDYYAYPAVGTGPRPLGPRDSVVVIPPDSVPNGIQYPRSCCLSPVRRTIAGLQPGLEIGVRLMPVGGLFIEAGGRFSLVTIDDPRQRARLGDVESRLVIAAGIAW